MQIEVLDYVVLIVADLDRSLSFYADTLGLRLRHRAEKYGLPLPRNPVTTLTGIRLP